MHFVKQKMKTDSLSLFDRFQFGAIAGVFGILVGGLIALIVMGVSYCVLAEPKAYNFWLVGYSGAFLYLAGMVQGADAAELVVDGFVASVAVLLGGLGIAGGGGTTIDGNLRWRRNMWWSVAFFIGATFIAWL